MATKPVTIEILGERTIRATWANMANGDDGAPIDWPYYADRSVQVRGTFGAAGSVTMEGSNDGANFEALSDPRGNALAINSAKIEQVEDCCFRTRPRVTAGDGTTSLTVVLFARKAN